VAGDAGGAESGSVGGEFLGLGSPSSALSWICGGGLVSSNGGNAASYG
jgi:hypothetical protein